MSDRDPQALHAEGDRLAAGGELGRARDAYARADALGHPAAAAKLGILDERDGKRAAAEEAYRRADERGSRLGALRLGLLSAGAERWDEARAAYARAEARPADADGADLTALLAEHGGRLAAARAPAGAAPRTDAFANPVIIGAVTVLIAIVAVFLAYSANSGLPFVPTRELKVDIPDGSNLVAGNDVREGGFRVGFVSDLRPVTMSNGITAAQVVLKLDKSRGRVPVDSRVTIRTRSVLGLKYVDIKLGVDSRVYPDGGMLVAGPNADPVQFDQIFDTFDKPTRRAIQRDLTGYGDAFAGHGGDLNRTIAALNPLFRHLTPVARYLSAPGTGLSPFLRALDAFMQQVAPVAATNVRLFADQATTFAALSKDPSALQNTISLSPGTLDVSTDSLRTQRPFLSDLTRFGTALAPAAASLRAALPDINQALEVGAATLARTPQLNARLQQVTQALKNVALAPGTNYAINALTDTVQTLNPFVRFLGPYVTVCNYWNHWWTDVAEHLSERTSFGYAQRVLLNFADATQPNNVGSLGATQAADGQMGGPEFLHSQAYGAAVSTSGLADCETGQRGYPLKLSSLDPKGRNLAVDSHTPGNQGPTFTGRPRVPKGETFTRDPSYGPQLAQTPGNP